MISRGFRALWIAHLCGAFNDSFLKVIVTLLAVNKMDSGGGQFQDVLWGSVCFVVPFLLLSPLAGSLADRHPKARIMQLVKVFEVAIALAAIFSFHSQSFGGLFCCLFLLGVHTAFFSPSKYGSLPELLDDTELSRGNGLMELATFAGAIAGSALAGFANPNTLLFTAAAMLGTSVLGLIFSLRIPVTAAQGSSTPLRFNPLDALKVLRDIRSMRSIWLAVLSIAYFWSLAALYQVNLSLSAKHLSGWDDIRTSILLAILGVGIGCGAALAGKVSEGKVELGLVPIGSALLGATSLVVVLFTHHYFLFAATIFVMGISGGFFVIPLNSFLQQQSPAEVRGSYIAALNSLTYLGYLACYGLMYFVVGLAGASPSAVFIIAGLSALLVTILACREMPTMLIRCLNWLLTHTLYRVQVTGLENIPKEGGALIICNHVAYVDPPIILAAARRPVRFLMYRPIYEHPFIRPIAKSAGAIPISPESPKRLVQSIQEARAAIVAGELVCIFAEGELTRLGHLLSFKKGYERIMKGLNAPIIPAFIDQAWGSIFSYRDGKAFWKIPKQIPYPVSLAFGPPMPGGSPAFAVRQVIHEMSADLACSRENRYSSLHSAFVHSCKRKWFSPCITDSSGKRLSYFGLLIAALCLRPRLLREIGEKKTAGVLLPPGVAGVLVNVALSFAQKVSLNLNFTASADSLEFALKRCEAEKIITSRTFLEKLGFPERPGMVFAEDLLKDFPWQEKLRWGAAAALLPQKFFLRRVLKDKTRSDDLATVIFSSGSTAEPKGVMLSHRNISSNIESIYQVFQLEKDDAVLGSLPFFHSFGFTATLWLPLLCGIRAVYHPNPMDAATIGELTAKERVSVLMSTPTFLLGYIRKCSKEQFQSLRFVIVGAEKLKDRIAQAFVEKFGIMPMEGYGATELSPVAIINVPNFRDTVVNQIGQKPGTVGHALPGVAVRVVDPDTFAVLQPESEGLLLVRGPNVMRGYLGNEEKTKEVIRDGWYVTGDIAKVDDDGFVTITDRLSRFSKIAGEMVPHVKVEEAIHQVLGETETVCAVTAVADEKKGEKLVVLTTKEVDSSEVTKKLSDLGLPNLWIPKKENFHRIASLPYLGTGKLDLKSIKKMASDFSTGAGAE